MGGDKPTCFRPDGALETSLDYQPCNQILGQPSMCCATNRTIPSGGVENTSAGKFTADLCLPNGLCQNNFIDAKGKATTQYWRESCSSQQWGTNACLSACWTGVDAHGDIAMTPCPPDNTTWCCGTSTSCCGTKAVITLSSTFGAQGLTTASPTAAAELSTNSTTSRNDLSAGAIFGIVVGVLLAVVLAGLAGWAVGRRRERKRAVATAVLPPQYDEIKDQINLPESRYWRGMNRTVVRTAELDSRLRFQPPEIDSRSVG